MSLWAWPQMASTTTGLQCPTIATPCPPTQSIYSRPCSSHTRAPSPRTIATSRLGYTPLVKRPSTVIVSNPNLLDPLLY